MTKRLHYKILKNLGKIIVFNFITVSLLIVSGLYINKHLKRGHMFIYSMDNFQSQSSIISVLIKNNQLNYQYINEHVSYIPLPDTRIIALRRFLRNYKSPLYNYASDIVQQADINGQDWRIIVAIAGVESAFGRITKYNSFNAWGWRGGPRGEFSNFHDWPQAIAYITQKFTKGYGKYPNPYAIYKTYCPPCTNAWPNGVTQYMKQLSFYRHQINKELINKKY